MLMDPQLSQQHTGLQQPVFGSQQEVSRLKASFKPSSPRGWWGSNQVPTYPGQLLPLYSPWWSNLASPVVPVAPSAFWVNMRAYWDKPTAFLKNMLPFKIRRTPNVGVLITSWWCLDQRVHYWLQKCLQSDAESAVKTFLFIWRRYF